MGERQGARWTCGTSSSCTTSTARAVWYGECSFCVLVRVQTSALTHQMNYPNYYNYNQYNYAQQGIPGQPGQQAQAQAPAHSTGTPDAHQASQSPVPAQPAAAGAATGAGAGAQQSGQGGWDQAAAAAYYQTSGWGGYYGEHSTNLGLCGKRGGRRADHGSA